MLQRERPDRICAAFDDHRLVANAGLVLSDTLGRHSPLSSVIRVSVQRDGVHVSFSVADQGRGIPAESLLLLFRKFSNVGSQEQGGDTRLGLAICKGIVEAHGAASGPRARAWPWGALHLHPAHGGGRERQGGFNPILAAAGRTGGMGAGAGGGRRPPGPALRPRHPGEGGLPAGVTGDPEEALRLMERERPDLVLLDLAPRGRRR